jgi:hypothetical protein
MCFQDEFNVCISHQCYGIVPRSQLVSLVAQDKLTRFIGQLSVTRLHLKLTNLKLIRDVDTNFGEEEEQWKSYAEQLAKASKLLRYLKVSVEVVPVVHWLVDRKGIQPTLTRLSRDEGERIADESFVFSRVEKHSDYVP